MLFSYTNLILSAIEPVVRGSASTVEVKASSERRFNDEIHSALEQMVQNTSCSSVSILHFITDTTNNDPRSTSSTKIQVKIGLFIRGIRSSYGGLHGGDRMMTGRMR